MRLDGFDPAHVLGERKRLRPSSSPWCSRHRDGGASRPADPSPSGPGNTSRRRRSRRPCRRSCRRCSARPADDAAAFRRSWRPHPRPRPRWCRCRSSVRCGRRIFPAASSRRESFSGSKFCSSSSSRDFGSAARTRGMKRARICRPAGIAAGRVEGEAGDRLALAHHVGEHRDDRGGHLGKIEARISDARIERDRAFADVDDTHRVMPFDGRLSVDIRWSGSDLQCGGADRSRGVATQHPPARQRCEAQQGDDNGRHRSFRNSPRNAGICRKERRAGETSLRRLHFARRTMPSTRSKAKPRPPAKAPRMSPKRR